MRFLGLILVLLISSCAYRTPVTQALKNPDLAQDSYAEGFVQASASKKIKNQNVCFEIKIVTKKIKQELATSSNWSAAWLDKNERYHLLNIHQREPASIPQSRKKNHHEGWITHFETCAPKASVHDLETLILTPKELPVENPRSLHLNWIK